METKIYKHIDYTLYCPKCKRVLWDDFKLRTITDIHCFHCGVDVIIDYERGVTRISEGISFHNNTVMQIREEVLNGEKVGQK